MAVAPRRSAPLPGRPRTSSRRLPCRPERLAGARLEQAVAEWHASLRDRMAHGDPRGVAACYLRIGDLYLGCGETERAGEMYRMSLQIARDCGGPPPTGPWPPEQSARSAP